MSTINRKDITTDIIIKLRPEGNMEVEDIILEHVKLCNKNGAVHLGTNLGCSEQTIRSIDEKGHDIRVIFVDDKEKNYRPIYIGDLIDIKIYKGSDKGYLNDTIPCPAYYKDQAKKAWLKLVNIRKIKSDEINLDDYKLLFHLDAKVVSDVIRNRPCLLYGYKNN